MSRDRYQDFLNTMARFIAKDTLKKTNGTIRNCVKVAVSDN